MKRSKISPALAKRAAEKATAAQARLREEARRDIAMISRRKAQIADAFYDIGEALARLRRPAAIAALGRKGFGEVCERDLGMSVTRAGELIDIVQRVTREDAVRWGQDKTTALLQLASATRTDDTPGTLAAQKIRLHSGKTFDPEKATTRAIRTLALEERRRRGSSRRGRTTTPEERRDAERLRRALVKLGLDHAKVRAVATRPGAISDVEIRVPFDGLRELRSALAAIHGSP